jgi:hypothetical protein
MKEIPNVYLIQATKENIEKAKSFQSDMGAYFFEHAMYDVKDAMSSILALCDIADMKELPEVRKYIQRVNDIISDVNLYHDRSAYNVRHILLNVIKILEGSYKHRLNITHRMVSINAKAHGYQGHLEQSLLYMVIEVLESAGLENEVKLEIDLSQKNHDAIITLRFDDYCFPEIVRKEILQMANQGGLTTQIFVDNEGTTISIRVGLTFDRKEKTDRAMERSFSVTLEPVKPKGLSANQLPKSTLRTQIEI